MRMTNRWLICGTRKKDYANLVRQVLGEIFSAKRVFHEDEEWKPQILEGCCPHSADQYAEEWAKENNIDDQHYPPEEGNYLKRNLEMLDDCTEVIAFFDGYSYGTSFVIANAVARGDRKSVV